MAEDVISLIWDMDELILAQFNVVGFRLLREANAEDQRTAWTERTAELNDPPAPMGKVADGHAVSHFEGFDRLSSFL